MKIVAIMLLFTGLSSGVVAQKTTVSKKSATLSPTNVPTVTPSKEVKTVTGKSNTPTAKTPAVTPKKAVVEKKKLKAIPKKK